MGVENVVGVAVKPLAKLAGKITGGALDAFSKGMGGDKPSSTDSSVSTSSNTAETDSATNQGRLNPLIFTSPQGVLDPANPGKKLLIGQ